MTALVSHVICDTNIRRVILIKCNISQMANTKSENALLEADIVIKCGLECFPFYMYCISEHFLPLKYTYLLTIKHGLRNVKFGHKICHESCCCKKWNHFEYIAFFDVTLTIRQQICFLYNFLSSKIHISKYPKHSLKFKCCKNVIMCEFPNLQLRKI